MKNIPMQYIVFFVSVLKMKIIVSRFCFTIFNMFAQNIDFGYTC